MDYYSILGVAKTATQEDIKKAYKRLAMRYHPDRADGDSVRFAEISDAYDTLGNAQKRAEYDNPHPNIRFEDYFHRGQRQRPKVNRNTIIQAQVSLADVLTGKVLYATYRTQSGKEHTAEINIPAGIRSGHVIQYRGIGDDTYPGPRGDLLVKVIVRPEKNWDRHNNDLMLTCYVNVLDMMVGGPVRMKTLDGQQIELKVPAGTQPGAKFGVQGHGAPEQHTGKRGDLFIIIQPEIPKVHDKELTEQLRSIRNAISKST